MKGIEDMCFSTIRTREGKWVGIVKQFPTLRTRPMANRLDAISEIVSLTSERLREIS